MEVFAKALETYLSQILGSGRVPLSYVLWRMVAAPANQAYATEQAMMIALAPLTGASLQRDNARVYGIVKQLVLELPGHTCILRFDSIADRRAAWSSLCNHYKSDSFCNWNIDDAYTLCMISDS